MIGGLARTVTGGKWTAPDIDVFCARLKETNLVYRFSIPVHLT